MDPVSPQPPPGPDDPELRKHQGKPDAYRCRWCNTSKFARSLGQGVALLCPHCDGITPRKD